MGIKEFSHMEYLDGMEEIDSRIMDQVLAAVDTYNENAYVKEDVLRTLAKEQMDTGDFKVLLSTAAQECLEEMAVRAMHETKRYFGNSVAMFTPLYLANYCENHCVYCGFNCHNKIHRGKLNPEEIEAEFQAISATGLREILLLTGESRAMSDVKYIGEGIKIARKYFDTIGIEIYPLNSDEYRYLKNCGADFVSVYQETYQTDIYEKMHKSGPKRSFPYRFHAQERALMGGMRGVAFGALLGLGNFRKDAYAAGIHAYYIQKKYPHAEISFSTPRLRPYKNHEEAGPNDVHERALLQVMLAFRIFLPFAGITISTRERAGFRDHVIGMCATKISAGVKTGVGGHEEEAKGDEQFKISDPRSVESVHEAILEAELQPVYRDYIRV